MRRYRLVHIGVAAAMAAATVTAIGLVQAAGADGTSSVFVPITPCRLIDTRAGSDNVGTRGTPIGSGEAASFQVTGANGNCTIPSSATGIATNATAVNPTTSSYITIYPAGADPRPTASNLNFVGGSAPTPNQVTVGLSAAGAIGVYNLSGTVDLIVDIVGYYQPVPTGGVTGALVNDDRYYTKTQVDATFAGVTGAISAANAAIATKQTRATGSQSLSFGPQGFFPTDNMYRWDVFNTSIAPHDTWATAICVSRPIELPVGATITKFSSVVKDADTTSGRAVSMALSRSNLDGSTLGEYPASMDTGFNTGANRPTGSIQTISSSPIQQIAVISGQYTYSVSFCANSPATVFYSGTITYTLV
ncbi:MAG: hypothetical protein JWN39_2714 [Ilumatobacteraceae bacterium]|nr:hypothetical protein [Ilumatobacteraceae bacterium]